MFVEFYSDLFFVKEIYTKKILMQGQAKRDLYRLIGSVSALNSFGVPSTRVASLGEWHSHLSHHCFSTASHIVNKHGLGVASKDKLFCEHC